jgi:zinc protease
MEKTMTEVIGDSGISLLADRIDERRVGPVRLLTLNTPIRDVISIKGSFVSEPDFGSGDDLLQDLVVSMLDKGTQSRDRFEIADQLDERGAQIGFSSRGRRTGFGGRLLKEHFADVLDLISDQLMHPLFDETEFEKTRAHIAASLQRELESTGTQASDALNRVLYETDHPNFTAPSREELKHLNRITIEDVRRYHAGHFGSRDPILVAAGDVRVDEIAGVVEDHFASWGDHPSAPRFRVESRAAAPGRTDVRMDDKQNLDVRMGHGLRMRRGDDDYLALYTGLFVLGGNFSARLMARIRDEQGLTYGIGAGIAGITTDHEGHWHVSISLSGENLDRGIESVRRELEAFVHDGITAEELEEKKTTIAGSYKVGLASTGGLAQAVINNAERGFANSYLDDFPAMISSLSVEQVNDAIRRYIALDGMHVSVAGTI